MADWWAPETKAKFVEKTKCVIDQYGSYKEVMTGLNLNGVTTQGENIADNGGTKEAYIAYGIKKHCHTGTNLWLVLNNSKITEDWVKDNEEEAGLPGFDFNPRQLFWISWGQVWCSKYREAAMKNQVPNLALINCTESCRTYSTNIFNTRSRLVPTRLGSIASSAPCPTRRSSPAHSSARRDQR